MRDKTHVFDNMLQIQAQISYPLEQPLFCSREWREAKQVLDFGCGNAAYTRMLADDNQDKIFTCVEQDPLMADIARARHDKAGLNIITGSYDGLTEDYIFDFLLMRLVASHLSDRESFCQWSAQHASPSAGVLVIDADDEFFYLSPDLPKFREALISLRENVNAKGGKRNVKHDVNKEWVEAGFKHLITQSIVVNSKLPGIKERMYIYMHLTAESSLGSPIPPEIIEELFSWVLNPYSYVQYGLFASLFTRAIN